MSVWVRHLFHCATAGGGAAEARLLGTEGSRVQFSTLEPGEAAVELERLVAFYRSALQRMVPFFPKTSLVYAEGVVRKAKTPMTAAWGEWLGGFYHSGESEKEPYPAIYPDPNSALDEEFARLALELLEPMLRAEKGGEA